MADITQQTNGANAPADANDGGKTQNFLPGLDSSLDSELDVFMRLAGGVSGPIST
jgi:hypothetical protein